MLELTVMLLLLLLLLLEVERYCELDVLPVMMTAASVSAAFESHSD